MSCALTAGNGLTANFGIKVFDTEDSAQKKAKILKQNRIEALEAELAVRVNCYSS